MRKSGHKTGGMYVTLLSVSVLEVSEEGEAKDEAGRGERRRRPKRCSHSGPERYVIVAISTNSKGMLDQCKSKLSFAFMSLRRASFMPV
jgi:hypothetical protein